MNVCQFFYVNTMAMALTVVVSTGVGARTDLFVWFGLFVCLFADKDPVLEVSS